jgi:hypothetical protein
MPRDAAAASQTTLSVQWLTAAEWQDWQADFGELPLGRTGTGPSLELEEEAASAAGVPQADTDKDDNGSYTTVTVSGTRRTDVVAIGATIPGTAGEHTISVGLVNQGPGTLRYPPFTNNAPDIHITLPVRTSVVTADARCTAVSDDYETPPSAGTDDSARFAPAQFFCAPRSVTLQPGQHLRFTFTVRTAGVANDDDGSVWIGLYGNGTSVDRDLRNNQAKITVTAADAGGHLPITGTTAATMAGGGLLLLLGGAAIVAALRGRYRRRPAAPALSALARLRSSSR